MQATLSSQTVTSINSRRQGDASFCFWNYNQNGSRLLLWSVPGPTVARNTNDMGRSTLLNAKTKRPVSPPRVKREGWFPTMSKHVAHDAFRRKLVTIQPTSNFLCTSTGSKHPFGSPLSRSPLTFCNAIFPLQSSRDTV